MMLALKSVEGPTRNPRASLMSSRSEPGKASMTLWKTEGHTKRAWLALFLERRIFEWIFGGDLWWIDSFVYTEVFGFFQELYIDI